MERIDSPLVKLCIEAATGSIDAVNRWRLQRRSLERLPSALASAILHRLLHRRLLIPSHLELFKYNVEEIDLRGENHVDAEWMAYVGAFPYLCSLNVAGCNRINNPALWPLAGMTSLKELDLSRCMKVTDAGIKHVLSISRLEKLLLSQTGLTAEGIRLLSALPNLITLDLGGLPVSDAALNSLQALTKLEHLDLWGSEISDEGVATLKYFPKLSFLNLAWTKVTVLPNLNSLECLNMSHCSIHSLVENGNDRITLRKLIVYGATFLEARNAFLSIDASCLSFLNLSNTSLSYFGFIEYMHALEHLDLSFSSIEDRALEVISCIGANLRHLNLNSTKVSSAGVEILAGHVPNLEVLSLSHTSIGDVAISYIGMMPSLKALDLSNTYIKGFSQNVSNNQDEFFSLAALEDLKHLENVNLDGTHVNDAALCVLSDFEALTHLSLNDCLLTDKCLDHLSSAKKLVNLCIRGSLLTDGALDSFNPPVTLEVLDLGGCWLLTVDALMKFCREHSGLMVRHDNLEMPSGYLQNSSSNVSSSRHSSKTSKLKQKHRSQASPVLFKKDVLDQRIKYSREELLAFQHLSSPLVSPLNIDTAMLNVE